jgi:hypothetical protein
MPPLPGDIPHSEVEAKLVDRLQRRREQASRQMLRTHLEANNGTQNPGQVLDALFPGVEVSRPEDIHAAILAALSAGVVTMDSQFRLTWVGSP